MAFVSSGWPLWRQDIERAAVKVESDRESLELTSTSDRVTVDLVLATGAPGSVEFRIRRDSVEVWMSEPRIGEHSCGVVDRQVLRQWLAEPGDALVFDEVIVQMDRRLDVSGRLALTVPGVSAWVFTPLDADRLTKRV